MSSCLFDEYDAATVLLLWTCSLKHETLRYDFKLWLLRSEKIVGDKTGAVRWVGNKPLGEYLIKTLWEYLQTVFFQTLVTNIMPPQEHNTCSRHVNSVVSCATDMVSTVCGIDRSLRDRPRDAYIKKINKKKLWNFFFFFVLVSLWFSCLFCSYKCRVLSHRSWGLQLAI